jgi:hypothetical protein
VEYVGDKKLGWNIEARLDGPLLRVEVKGTCSQTSAVELTPNEYEMLKKHKDSYRLCIVIDVLMSPFLWPFQWVTESGCWCDSEGRRLLFADWIGAVVEVQ